MLPLADNKPKRIYKCRICGQPKKGHICVDVKNILDSQNTSGYYTRSRAKGIPVPEPKVRPTKPSIYSRIIQRANMDQPRTDPIGEDEYQVERVLGFRPKGRGYQVLTKWEGYDEPEWIAYSNTNCDGLIFDYLFCVGPLSF